MEVDLCNYVGVRKVVEDVDKLIKKFEEEIKKVNSDEIKKKDLEV